MALKNRILLAPAAAAAAPPPHRTDDAAVVGVRAHARDILLYTERFAAAVVVAATEWMCNDSYARGPADWRLNRFLSFFFFHSCDAVEKISTTQHRCERPRRLDRVSFRYAYVSTTGRSAAPTTQTVRYALLSSLRRVHKRIKYI